MKLLIASCASLLLLAAACTKKEKPEPGALVPATVIRDCTSTYLRLEDGKDYNICNQEVVADYVNGTKVEAYYRSIEACPSNDDRVICLMYHPSEGWIEVLHVR